MNTKRFLLITSCAAAMALSSCTNSPVSIDKPVETSAGISKPDLRFPKVVITSRTSSKVNYFYKIKNSGTATINDIYNITIQNFYSKDKVFNNSGDLAAGGTIIGVHTSLAPGATYTGTFAGFGAVPAGMNYLTIKIDWDNAVAESNENNNTYALPVFEIIR